MASFIAKDVRARLRTAADPASVERSRRFFTEPVRPIGVSVPGCTKVVMNSLQDAKRAGVAVAPADAKAAAEDLYSSGMLEEQFCANILLSRFEKKLEEKDIAFFEALIATRVDNWACCDGLCSVLGRLYARYPKQAQKTRAWTKSGNRWVRRASAVCFVLPASRGAFIDLAYGNVSAMLCDPDDLVRKANGWALRQAGKFDEARLVSFLESHADMPAITLSYAMEKLGDKARKRIRSLRPIGSKK